LKGGCGLTESGPAFPKAGVPGRQNRCRDPEHRIAGAIEVACPQGETGGNARGNSATYLETRGSA